MTAPGAAGALRGSLAAGVMPRLHVALTSERGLPPWRALTGVSTITDRRGALHHDVGRLYAGAADEDVHAEVAAQHAWYTDHGITPAGVDSHAGTLYGLGGRQWLAPTLRHCAVHGLPFRLPRDLVPYAGETVAAQLAAPHRAAVRLADDLGVPIPATMITNMRTAAELGGYDGLLHATIDRLRSLPPGTSELFLHPAPAEAPGVDPVRAWELRLLRDPRFADAIAREGIELVSSW